MQAPATFPLLGGKLHLLNIPPRPTEDPLWLAATIPQLSPGSRVLDCGTGTGIAALALLIHQPHLHLEALDLDPELTRLAAQNAALNHLSLTTHTANILENPQLPLYDAILCNPPYHGADRGHTTPNPHKARAHTLPAHHLTLWLHALTALLTPAGTLHLILHSACQPELTAFAAAHHALTITPLQTSPNRPAKRLLATLQASSNPQLIHQPTLEAFNPTLRHKALGS